MQLQAATLALLSAACDRAARLTQSLPQRAVANLSSALRQHLPEVQTLLSLRARFDPFTAAAATTATAAAIATEAAAIAVVEAESMDTVVANVPELEALASQQEQPQAEVAVTAQQLQQQKADLYCSLLALLTQCTAVAPAAVEAARFDFLKLLPQAQPLLGASPQLQCALLQLLAAARTQSSSWVAAASASASSTTGSSACDSPLEVVLTVMKQTLDAQVRAAARRAAVAALLSTGLFEGASSSSSSAVDDADNTEIALWLDQVRCVYDCDLLQSHALNTLCILRSIVHCASVWLLLAIVVKEDRCNSVQM
jgi:hypothetical protein